MKIAIRYYSKTGNTMKLANAIGEELGVEAQNVAHPLTEDVDILFLGGSPYATTLNKELKDFVKGIHVKVGEIVTFSSAALLTTMHPQFARCIKAKNITLADEEFMCRGKFLHMHASHPDEKDLENAKAFAKKVVESRQK